MTQPGETTDYSVAEHLRAIQDHVNPRIMDYVVANRQKVSPAVARRYRSSRVLRKSLSTLPDFANSVCASFLATSSKSTPRFATIPRASPACCSMSFSAFRQSLIRRSLSAPAFIPATIPLLRRILSSNHFVWSHNEHSIRPCPRTVGVAVLLLASLSIAAQTPAPSAASNANQMPSVTKVPAGAQPSDHFDATAATNAYLAEIPPSATARSDAYFEGGYWMILWDFLFAIIVYWLLLRWKISAAMRNFAERLTRFRPIQTFLYWAQFTILTFIVGFPLTAYESFFREKRYGLATQTFGGWGIDQFKSLLIGIILGGLIAMLLVGIVRKFPNTWHIWGAIATMIIAVFLIALAPVRPDSDFLSPHKIE